MPPWTRIVNAIVVQCSQTYQLEPWWWKTTGSVCRRREGQALRRECFSLIVANCYSRGMHSAPGKSEATREHVETHLGIGHGTVAYYVSYFRRIPEYHQRLLRTFTGQSAALAVRQHQLSWLPPLELSRLEVPR